MGYPSPPCPPPIFQPSLPSPFPIMASEPRTGMLAAEQHPVGRKLDNAFVTPRIVCHWREFTLGLDLPSRVRCSPLPGPANTVYPNFPPKIAPSPAERCLYPRLLPLPSLSSLAPTNKSVEYLFIILTRVGIILRVRYIIVIKRVRTRECQSGSPYGNN